MPKLTACWVGRIIGFIVITGTLGCVSASTKTTTKTCGSLIQLIQQTSPDVDWNIESFLKLDINDDGRPDYALLGTKDESRISVAVVLAGIKKESIVKILNVRPRYLPVSLTTESMDYEPSEPAPGFKRSKKAQGLRLDDDMTDSIHIYWNHKTNNLGRWSL